VVRRAWQLRRAMLTWYCAKGSRHIDGKDLALPCQNFLYTLGGRSESELRTLRWRPQHLCLYGLKAQGASTHTPHPDEPTSAIGRRCAALRCAAVSQ
jgi:hypothetical protein